MSISNAAKTLTQTIMSELKDIGLKTHDEKVSFLYDLQESLPHINYAPIYGAMRGVADNDLHKIMTRDKGLTDLVDASVASMV